jgi:hypothetical protein
MPERRMIADTPQVFFPDFNTFILFKLLPDKRIQFIKAAAAGSLSNIPGIPPENRYEKYVEIPVQLMDLIPGQAPARGTYDIVASPYMPFLILYAEKPYEKHIAHSFLPVLLSYYISNQRNNIKSYFSLLTCSQQAKPCEPVIR